MRTRLAHVLSFWLLGAVALSVLGMGGVSAWHLRQGFVAYLQARDVERLDRFALLVAGRMQRATVDSASRGDPAAPPDMRGLLRELAVLEGLPSGPPPAPNGPPAAGPEGAGGPDREPGAGPGRPPPHGPQGREDAFGARVRLLRPDGSHWAGPRLAPGAQGLVERPVFLAGQLAARLQLRPAAPLPGGIETQFLRSQYLGIAAVAAAMLLLALGSALGLARQWARPLRAVQEATTRIAAGELGVRVPIERGDEIGDVVRNVNAMAASLQRIEGARRRWLADLSHELRTPLAALRGEIEALVDGVRQPSAAAFASLHEDVLRLGRLVDDLHLLAMADLQTLPYRCTEADAVDIAEAALQRHAAFARDAGLTLGWRSTPTAPVPVRWDALRIDQVLTNLLQNSLRYTDAPGRIELSLHEAAGTVHLSVDDSAPGVAPLDLPRLFEPLFRADAARSRHNGGSGLGLAICRAIVAAHGGRVGVSASPLGGLRVHVELPVNAVGRGT